MKLWLLIDKYKAHIIFWSIYFLFCYATDTVIYGGVRMMAEILFFITNNLYLFYTIYFFISLSRFKDVVSSAKSVLMFIVIIFVSLCIRYSVRFKLLAVFVDPIYGSLELDRWLVQSAIWIVNYSFFASAYYYFKTSMTNQSKINRLREEQLIHEKRVLDLENKALRAQMNPHVLYNTLNFLYAKSLPVSSELSEGILTLSEIMQYSLKSEDSDGLVLLSDELEQVENVVNLARLKSNNRTFIRLEIGTFDKMTKVVPLLLLTLVENIFKHGDVSESDCPALITVGEGPNNTIRFSTTNKLGKSKELPGTSLGLSYARNRLDKEYGNESSIAITKNDNLFQVEVLFPITRLNGNARLRSCDFQTTDFNPTTLIDARKSVEFS